MRYSTKHFSILTLRSYTNEKRKYRTYREKGIHGLQLVEMLFIGYYILFAVEMLVHAIKTRSMKRAYLSVSLVKEARTMASVYSSYGLMISVRTRYAWLEELRDEQEDKPLIHPTKRNDR